ncbi:MAG: acyltransferase [Leptospiraceae bacterium]|nr:acyltransferase [Leptospiraceae bacterium]
MTQFWKNFFTKVFQTEKAEISSLNGIRSILIFLLFFGHMYSIASDSGKMPEINPYLKNLSRNITFILDVFFVLSGFLIATPLFKELNRDQTISLKFFYIRRTLRIFPPYYIFLLLQTFIIVYLAKVASKPEHIELSQTMLSMLKYDYLYLSNYFQGTMLHGWSLSLEEQFYISFPLFLVFVFKHLSKRWQFASLILLYLVPLFFRYFTFVQFVLPAGENAGMVYENKIYKPFHTHADSIFAGIIVGFIFVNHKEWIDSLFERELLSKLLHLGAWVVLFAYNLLSYELNPTYYNQVFRFTINNLTTSIILLFALKPGLVTKFFSLGIFSPIAKLSYIAYLLHMLLLGYLMYPLSKKEVIRFEDILIYWLPFSFVIFVFSYMFHLFAERPFMYLKDYLTANYKKAEIKSDVKQK